MEKAFRKRSYVWGVRKDAKPCACICVCACLREVGLSSRTSDSIRKRWTDATIATHREIERAMFTLQVLHRVCVRWYYSMCYNVVALYNKTNVEAIAFPFYTPSEPSGFRLRCIMNNASQWIKCLHTITQTPIHIGSLFKSFMYRFNGQLQ